MTLVRRLRVGLALPLLLSALCAACGGDTEEAEGQDPAEGERQGPAGCYIGAERRCDCDLEESECTAEGSSWVMMGCTSCVM